LYIADTAPKYLLNQNSSQGKRIIKCGLSSCAVDAGSIGYYLDSGKEDSTSHDITGLIKCTDPATKACESVDSPVNYFVNAETVNVDDDGKATYSGLISCDSTNVCTKATGITEGIYLNGAVDSSNKFTNALIKCTTSGQNLSCEEVSLTPNDDDNSIFLLNDKTILRCKDSSSGCTVIDPSTSAALYGTADIPFYFVNSVASGLTKAIIECKGTTDKCGAIDAVNGSVYFNGNVSENTNNPNGVADQLITCDSTGCSTTEITLSTENPNAYYSNSGTYKVSSVAYPLIKCTYSSGTTCDKQAGVEGVFFINGNYSGTGKSYLIKCTSATECGIYTDAQGVIDKPEYYLNGAGTGVTEMVLRCDITAKNVANNIGKRTTKTIVEPEIEGSCSPLTTAAYKIYFNSDTGKLIQCGASSCAAYAGIGSDSEKAFYVNGDVPTTPTNYNGAIIECNQTCSIVDGDEHNVYINANLQVASGSPSNANGIASKPLIICKENKCEDAAALAANTFYENAGINTASDYGKLIISCTTATDACTLVNGAVNAIYVNGNTNDANRKLIICTAGACDASEVTFEEGVTKKYYINAGIDTQNPLTLALITCEAGATCSSGNVALPTGATEIFYINGNYGVDPTNYLIKCSTSCVPYANTDIDYSTKEYYINGAVASGLTDAVIEVAFVKDSEQSRKRTVTYTASMSLQTPEAGFIYINAFDKNLIQCKTACKATSALVGTEDSPNYFVNGDPENESSNFSGRLIKCEGTTKKCSLMNGKDNGVYINGNFNVADNSEGEEGKRLIICSANKCQSIADNAAPAYYINGASTKTDLTDSLIKCTDTGENACEILATGVEANQIYLNGNFKATEESSFTDSVNHLIVCLTDKCQGKPSQANKDNNEFYINASDGTKDLEIDLIKCYLDETTNAKVCIESDGKPDFVYIDSLIKGNIIYCTDSCNTKPSFTSDETGELPKFYVNGDDVDLDQDGKDQQPLNGDLIKCTKTVNGSETKTTCVVAKGDNNNVYINSNYSKDDGDDTNQLIICTEEEGCLAKSCSSDTQTTPDTPDTPAKRDTPNPEDDPSVNLDDESSSERFPKYYINSGNPHKLDNGIIQCTSIDEACTLMTAKQNQVYKNANDNETLKPIIKCGSNNCKTVESSASENNNEYFKNAGDNGETPLEYDIIECSKVGESDVTCTEVENVNEGVYLNSNYAETGDKDQLIQCSSDNGCVGLRSESKDGEYFVNAEATTSTNAIILCINKKCEKQTPNSIPSFYVGYMKDEVDGLIKCTDKDTSCEFKAAFTSQGYYLNSGYNKAQNQTILCDSSDGCASLKVDLGYYVNEGEEEKPIIKCEKEGSECVSEESPSCPEIETAKPGNYCYDDGQLKFFPENNSTSIFASKSEDVYTFATISDNGFPGIKRETGSLFKISRYFINRFYQSGVVMIDKNGKLVDSLSSDQSDITLYDCNDSTKICTEKPGCTSNTYMYDSENKKVIFCNNGKLEYAEFNGYVVDSNRAIGSNHPYIIKCENGKCKSELPKVTSYYENSGYDSTTNALIQCSNNNCYTVQAEVGYYVGHGGAGIIQCTSTTSCNFNEVKNKVKYVNAGSNKSSNAIIDCSKNGCSAVKAKIGYYMTYSSNLLIQCTSPSSCVEFTPTVNYYDNADSSEGSNTIINCVQSSQVITCATEQTNNGFYMSSIPNVLIRCKSGSKCKTVVVKNGIFRGALKGLTGGSKRSEVEDVELEDDDSMGMSVAMPRDADDAYGIIRCVAGKCTALTASEIASIPVCEFNNNKCYITLEYAMTKSATTSITAGNICTNADRSVFYFATDTIVVKPNVISGVTATYVYTTTNSNCLEVNDSYTDMYFTVGSNIYLLDQGSVLQFYEQGYYFINTAKNALVNGNDIDAYNDENVKLYKCNGSSCSITDKPESLTYYADINKRILKYNVNSDSYSFAYPKDIICIFANNKCTPNADLKNQEFCITYKGELVLAKQDINNRETGECYKANSITNTIYGYSQYLYNMNIFSAEMVDESGYYIVNLSTNTTVVSKNYKTKNNNLVIYGCQLSSCKEYTPDEDTYYYDARAKTILRYRNGIWSTPDTSGYAYISLDPSTSYIYRFTKKLDEITINAMANYGYYYTVDGEMYHCNQDEDGHCVPISSTGYYFTNAGEVFYCVHDSEELEPTECTKQACVSGQYYYIDEAYFRCESSSTLVPVMSRYCSYSENVIINFPLALTDEYPDKIKQAVEGIEKNNNSTAIVTRRGKNYLESVSGIFTNCTYNVEETKSTFDLVCVNNYVAVDKETDDVKICSMEQLGYVECIEDEENPEKCNISWALPTVLHPSFVYILIMTIIVAFINRI